MDHVFYQKLVERESVFFDGVAPILSIPKIFSYWAARYLSPRLIEMFGTNSIEEFFANEIDRVVPSGHLGILSLGSGEASAEIGIAKFLKDKGRDFSFYCTDISDGMNNVAKNNARMAGFEAEFQTFKSDVNQAFPSIDANIVIANHSLHHFIGLEYIFENVRRQIGRDGAFIVNDMIGRNGHQRWPEVHRLVEVFWNLLPIEKRVDLIHKVPRPIFEDFDCANGTFEGIRAQDILPLCCDNFEFERFLGFGGLPDIFLDRMYGGNFDVNVEFDLAFVDALEEVNSALLLSGAIKPTAMFATMRQKADNPRSWPSSPLESIRPCR
jgi:SAM-dependent methyltransferase